MTEPSRAPSRSRFRRTAAVGLLLLALSSGASEPDGGARVSAGVRLFRALLAADTAIESKTDAEGRLVVLVFYATDASRADRVATLLATPGEGQGAATIRDRPLIVELSSDPSFLAYADRPIAGIFIAEAPKDDALQRIVRFGIERHVIVDSPHEGHVEKGVLGGISVEAKVQPYINRATLDASGISLKPFFLKVSKLTR